MSFSRREFLRRTGMTVGVVSLASMGVNCTEDDPSEQPQPLPEYEYDGPLGPETLFTHGVASGDPLATSVIIWTRVSPEPADDSAQPLDVWFEVALDPEFASRVEVGWFATDATRDYTVKVDVQGLKPGQTYYYRFKSLGRTSPIGRTRTTPDGEVDRLRFGVVSCANYTSAYFHAYGYVANRHDLDAVIHLGDYIYEYGPGGLGGNLEMPGRVLDPPYEILTLEDYRRRYACYRLEAELQECHRQHPFILIWDDHETANNSWPGGAQNHTEGSEGSWETRKAGALKAYFEWMPVRDNDEQRLWRTIRYGDLVDLIMLDTRLWGRDETTNDREGQLSAERTLLGADQEEWLAQQLATSKAKWRVIGQQVMMGQLKVSAGLKEEGGGTIINTDQWDGYEASRDKFFKALTDNSVDNVVVLTGDIHTSWAIDLHPDPNNSAVYNPESGEGALAVEFVTPGISSPGLKNSPLVQRAIDRSNPHIKWYDLEHRGYIVLDVTAERVQSTWYLVEDATSAQTRQYFGQAYSVYDQDSRLKADDNPLPAPTDFPAAAP